MATLVLAVTPDAGLRDDYELKLNSYDLSVDIELYDAVQRLRFEHPEVKAVVVTGGPDPATSKVFCAGANIQMLAGSTHGHKVNFCKFTNETRNGIEDATANSGQTWIAAVNGTAAGGGYELALACDEIVLVDDRSSAVSLPEVPLLAVLPGTGGLTRVVDKRHVRRDLADVFATRSEGVKGQQAVEWGLVDVVAPRSAFAELVRQRAIERAAGSDRPDDGPGVALTPLTRTVEGDVTRYEHVTVELDRAVGAVTITVAGPTTAQPATADELTDDGRRGLDPRHGRASSTTPSCVCASTSPSSARGSCARPATPTPSPRPRRSSPTITGWRARSGCTGCARSSGSTCRRAPSSPSSSRAAASPARSPSWRSAPTAR